MLILFGLAWQLPVVCQLTVRLFFLFCKKNRVNVIGLFLIFGLIFHAHVFNTPIGDWLIQLSISQMQLRIPICSILFHLVARHRNAERSVDALIEYRRIYDIMELVNNNEKLLSSSMADLEVTGTLQMLSPLRATIQKLCSRAGLSPDAGRKLAKVYALGAREAGKLEDITAAKVYLGKRIRMLETRLVYGPNPGVNVEERDLTPAQRAVVMERYGVIYLM